MVAFTVHVMTDLCGGLVFTVFQALWNQGVAKSNHVTDIVDILPINFQL